MTMTIGEFFKQLKMQSKKKKEETKFDCVKCKKCGATSKTLRKVEDYYLCVDCYKKKA